MSLGYLVDILLDDGRHDEVGGDGRDDQKAARYHTHPLEDAQPFHCSRSSELIALFVVLLFFHASYLYAC